MNETYTKSSQRLCEPSSVTDPNFASLFYSNVQEFLRQSSDIQQDIHRLARAGKAQSRADLKIKRPGLHKRRYPEENNAETTEGHRPWTKLNKGLQQCSLPLVKLTAEGKPDLFSVERSMSALLSELTDKTQLVQKLSEDNMRLATELVRPTESHLSKRHSNNKADALASASQSMQQLCSKLETESFQEALQLVDKMQEVVEAVPKVQTFLSEVAIEVLGSDADPLQFDERVLRALRSNQARSHALQQFQQQMYEALDVSSEKEALNRCIALGQFKRLFQVKTNEGQVVEDLYWFVHEVKAFLKSARRRLSLRSQASVGEVLRNVLARL